MSSQANDTSHKTLLKNALQALDEMQAKLDVATQAQHAAIAIIGMGCRFPGGANDPAAYWDLLLRGVDAVRELPAERWSKEQYATLDVSVAWYGGFLDGIDQFDPHFFGISPREAASLDPQQRLVLEVGWEALEAAGQAPDKLLGSQTGVYLGISTNDYGYMLRHASPTQMDAYAATGGSINAAAGRLSFTLGLQGPAVAVDTACSSSLVAVHLACQSLRAGESRMALAGGVNVALAAESFIALSRWGMMSPDGRCKTFDADANGFVRAEGCGMIVLKRLDDAVADGDRILAVIRGSAVNQDGRSSGLTVPNGLAQQAVVRKALADAGVAPAEISCVEAHGTGTALGDPIEVEALGAVLGEGRREDQPLVLGSAKTNLGHLESAAGVAGLIKLVLSLQHEMIPPVVHFRQRSPRIPWPAFPVEIPTTPRPWPRGAKPRLCGVSAFGFSGTNAHILLQEAPQRAAQPAVSNADGAEPSDRPLHILTAAAPVEGALDALAARYAGYVASNLAQPLSDLAYTANTGRSQFNHRLAVIAADHPTLVAGLAAAAAGRAEPNVWRGGVARNERTHTAFLFTGQGAQYAGMGRRLYTTQPTFRHALDTCAAMLEPHLDRPLLPVLFGTDTGARLIDETTYTQPVLFAIEYALAVLWQSWGVRPYAVLGHSIGEYAAAVVAGVLRLEDAARLVAARGRLMGALPQVGEMLAVMAGEEVVAGAVAHLADRVSIAAVNGPESVVISGRREDVMALGAGFTAAGIKTQRLTVSHAFHSPLMEPMLDAFHAVAASVTYYRPTLHLVSNVTGKLAGDEVATPGYWVRHVRAAVRFADGVRALHKQGVGIFLEVGPKPTLLGMAAQSAPPDRVVAMLPSLRAGHDDWQQLLGSLAELYIRGVDIDWQGFDHDYARRKVVLPTYPFQRKRYWLTVPPQARTMAGVRPLVDKATRLPLSGQAVYETLFSVEALPFLAEHRVHETVISPGACQLVMALNAADLALGTGGAPALVDVVLPQALVVPPGEERTVQAMFGPPAASAGKNGHHEGGQHGHGQQEHGLRPQQLEFKLISFGGQAAGPLSAVPSEGETAVHAVGTAVPAGGLPPAVDLDILRASCPEPVDIAAFYAASAAAHIELGPSFRWLAGAWRGGEEGAPEALAYLARPAAAVSLENGTTEAGLIDPTLLDACFQVIGLAGDATGETLLPFALDRLELSRRVQGQNWWCHAVQRGERSWDIRLLDELGEPAMIVHGFQVRPASAAAVREDVWRKWLYAVEWESQPLGASVGAAVGASVGAAAHAVAGTWLIFADGQGIGAALASQLRLGGARVLLVHAGSAWQQDSDDIWIAPDSSEDYRRLLRQAGSTCGVVHLWSVAGCLEPDTLASAVEKNCSSALLLAQALVQEDTAPAGLWLVTQDAHAAAPGDRVEGLAQAGLWGMGKVIASEHPELKPFCVDLAQRIDVAVQAAYLAAEIALAAEPGASEPQVALRPDGRYTPRLQHFTASEGLPIPPAPFRLEIRERGLLENLQLRALPRRAPARGEVEIEVHASGLNFRDVLNVLGAYPGDPGPVGGECAGIVVAVGEDVTGVEPGDAVVTMTGGSISRYVTAGAAFVARKPAVLTMVEAAAVPIAYLTAWYGLHRLAQIKPGDRVLIHAAAGGVGMAAVQVAQQAGAEVFATASLHKWDVLRALGVTHLYNSRTVDFAAQILADTDGAGVAVVLNSLTGPGFMEANLAVLAEDGCLAEMSKRNIWSADEVAAVRPRARYIPFDLGETCLQQPPLWRQLFDEIAQLINCGELKPLPCTVFGVQDAVAAFRTMQGARHIGKIVLVPPAGVRDETGVLAMRGDATYLITGGLGGLGLAVAQGLAERGARHLLLLGRRPPEAATVAQLDALAQAGVSIAVVQADVADLAQLRAALEQVDVQHPLRGVVHCAGVLDDGSLLQQTPARFAKVFAPKVAGAWHLHQLLQEKPLDFFVLFSSAASLLGSRGQANYAAANAFLDELAHHRRARGLPALSINWGAWSEVGMAARLAKTHRAGMAAHGVRTLHPAQGVAALAHLLGCSAAQVGVLPLDWAALQAADDAALRMPLLAHFVADRADAMRGHARLPDPVQLTRTRLNAAGAEQRRELLHTYLVQQVAHVLHVPVHELNTGDPLTYMGLDSLMAVELRNRINTDLQYAVALSQLLEGLSVTDLHRLLLEELGSGASAADPVTAAERVQDPAAVLSELDAMSEENVDRLLEQLLAEEGLQS